MAEKSWIEIVNQYLQKLADFCELAGEDRKKFLTDMYKGLFTRIFADLEVKLDEKKKAEFGEMVTRATDSQEEMIRAGDWLIAETSAVKEYDVGVRVMEMKKMLDESLGQKLSDAEKKELEEIMDNLVGDKKL